MTIPKPLAQTPAVKRSPRDKSKRETAAAPKPRFHNVPDKFTYALKGYTAERRENGWYVSRTWTSSFGEKPQWSGPFATIETACLSIARKLAIDLADRHTQSIERYGITRSDGRYGLKPTTRLHQRQQKAKTNGSAL